MEYEYHIDLIFIYPEIQINRIGTMNRGNTIVRQNNPGIQIVFPPLPFRKCEPHRLSSLPRVILIDTCASINTLMTWMEYRGLLVLLI